MKLKHTILFLTFVALNFFSFGQYREFVPAIPYSKGDTVKVTSKGALFVAAVDLKSPEKLPAENRYWNYAGPSNSLTLEKLDARLKVLEGLFGFDTTKTDTIVYVPSVIDSVVYVPPTDTLGTYIYIQPALTGKIGRASCRERV